MEIEFREVVGNQEESFFAPVRAVVLSDGEFGFDIAAGLIDRFREQGHILVRPLDIVKRRFGLIAHITPFRPPVLICSIVAQLKPASMVLRQFVRCRTRRRLLAFVQNANCIEIAMLFRIIEAIANDEPVGDGEPDVVHVDRAETPLGLIQ